ncbi:MAG: CTP synthase [Lachnospiraceae bacterium]|nr:CTP synthase [Lachnospiraceae bacterium]
MSGGIAYVLDKDHSLYRRINKDMIELEEVSEKVDREELKTILEDYVKCTGSKLGKEILDNFDEELLCFKKVIARDYQRMIRTIAKYEAPLMLEDSGFSKIVCRELGIEAGDPDLGHWREMVDRIKNLKKTAVIGLVGKYVQLHDAYLSVAEALRHAGYENDAKVQIKWIDSEKITEENVEETFKGIDGIIVPGGFGDRGIEGMITSARYARTHDVPYFGICLGMQIACIEFARNVLGYEDANSGEFDELCAHKVIDFMPGQSDIINKGGTLRLGAYPCKISDNSKMKEYYGKEEISERHRHRYEFNNDFKEAFEKAGATFAGMSPDGKLVEEMEITDKNFYLGVQYHPEFKSRPDKAHPLFKGFVKEACKRNGNS